MLIINSSAYTNSSSAVKSLYDALHDFIPIVQFKNREKHTWRSKLATLLKVTLLHGYYFTFLKLCKCYQFYFTKTKSGN